MPKVLGLIQMHRNTTPSMFGKKEGHGFTNNRCIVLHQQLSRLISTVK